MEDITARKRLEAQILKVSEAEQRRIGQDLHDSVGQKLTGIMYAIGSLQRRLAGRALPEAEGAASAVQLIEEVAAEVRALARGLAPVGVDAGGLAAALEALAREVRTRCNVACRVLCDGEAGIRDGSAATHVYRIAQEAVNNAVRHGGASEVWITLSASDGHVVLTVRDNGSGVGAEGPQTPGLGLHLMSYRAQMLSGTLSVEPAGQGGTLVTCSFPWSGVDGSETQDDG
jgi:signal transduction histidine kinase